MLHTEGGIAVAGFVVAGALAPWTTAVAFATLATVVVVAEEDGDGEEGVEEVVVPERVPSSPKKGPTSCLAFALEFGMPLPPAWVVAWIVSKHDSMYGIIRCG